MNHSPHSPPSSVRLTALGGLGEIGMNCLLLEDGDDAILIDCGVMFPDHTTPGIDLVIPDYTCLSEFKHKLKGVIVTHGHEDHIGGLPFLFDQLNVPIYGTRFTLALVQRRVEEHRQWGSKLRRREDNRDQGEKAPYRETRPEPTCVTVRPGDKVQLGRIQVEFIGIYHSIIDSTALAITTSAGVIVHTGDFKFDATPTSTHGTNLQRFKDLGEEGVQLLLSDSTNVERPGHSTSERVIRERFHQYFAKAGGRVFVTLFASHIHRISQLIELSALFNRRVVLVGRSLLTNTAIATDLGLLTMDPGMVSDNTSWVEKLPPEQVTVILTGCQGEARSALARIAGDDHDGIKVGEGDLVIISSRSIPGNERALHKMINALYENGAEVIYENVAPVHASGHAHQEELQKIIELVRPKYFIPVHGEHRHLILHARLAGEYDFIEESIVAVNGDLVEVSTDQIRHRPGVFKTGRVFLDGGGRDQVDQSLIRDRCRMARSGVMVATVLVDQARGVLIGQPRVAQAGVFDEDAQGGGEGCPARESGPELLEEAGELVGQAAERVVSSPNFGLAELEGEIRQELRRFARKRLGKRPVVIPVVITV